MAIVLHLLGTGDASLAVAAMEAQVAAGDQVTVALTGQAAPDLPAGVSSRRVPVDLPYSGLLDLIFASDQVMAW